MSTNKTTHYGLHAWEPEDSVIRTEFNENFAALDTALHDRAQAHTELEATVSTKATQTDLNSLKTTVSNLTTTVNGKAAIVTGTYTATDPSETQTITLGFRPSAVLLEQYAGARTSSGSAFGGLAFPNHPLGSNNILVITSTGFTVTLGANDDSDVHYYIAFR